VDNIFGLTRAGLARQLASVARANVVFHGLYRDNAAHWKEIPGIPSAIRSRVSESLQLELPAVLQRFDSNDGTRRYLLALADGERVESVYIPSPERITLCISSQIGCALGCAFCLTAQLGLVRDLSAAEIVGQVVRLLRENQAQSPRRVSIVLMGMGEPLQNYDSVVRAIEILQDDSGLAIPLSRITVSTAGLIPGIERLAREKRFPNLSISLTGTRNASRDLLMPINRKYPIERVMETVRDMPYSRQRRVMFECVLIKGHTDSVADAYALSEQVRGMPVKVNLIPFNPAPGVAFERPSMESVLTYQRVLVDAGIATFIRRNRGTDISGACGQLRLTGASRRAIT
jgi:23S rRNA (adenine2503-C2)-methyltransferase